MSLVRIGVLFLLYLMLVAGCWQISSEHQAKLQEAHRGLEQAIDPVRHFTDFDVLAVKYYERYDDEHGPGPTCYYARAYLLVGTSLSVPTALDTFAQRLESLDWAVQGSQYPTSRQLVHGRYERAVFDSDGPGPELDKAADYDQLARNYRGLIYLNIDYILPAVNGC